MTITAAADEVGEPSFEGDHHHGSTGWLTLGAIGIVFGDIGTSPLYALKESFIGHHPMPVMESRVMGVISIIFWTMMIVVTLKYVAIMMRADNKGEGGSLSLLALLSRTGSAGKWTGGLTMLGVFATALFFGDAMITPAVSILSAVEGVNTIDARFESFAVPLAVVIIIGLFAGQKYGTHRVGNLFGPIMLFYFLVLTVLGVESIAASPVILKSLSPVYGIRFIAHDPGFAFLALGSIVLAVTGAEALYADMGHFGAKPIRLAWLAVAFPALMVNYLGQGALLLRTPKAIENPFYMLASEQWRLGLIILAVVATVIASQAVITGAFSVVRQAVQLGLFPRILIRHTSARAEGQIYIPLVNWSLCVMVLVLVLLFRNSSNLASAYGIAVTGTMFITTVMLAVLLFRYWNWPKWVSVPLIVLLATVDLTYFASNLTKFFDGGWFPVLIALAAFAVLTTWSKGRQLVHEQLASAAMPVELFVKSVSKGVHRIRGTAIYLTSSPTGIPPALLHNLKHNQVLHETVLLTTIRIKDVPFVPEDKRVGVQELGCGLKRVTLRFGFSEDIDVPAALALAKAEVGTCQPMTTSYFLSRQTVIPSSKPGMAMWRERLFGWMVRNSATAMDFFKLPPNRVVELGSQVTI
ncbi:MULTISPECIES: potassium transporter Kup [Sphingomonas]|uniref:potassium transporter Kup n=1 Tax=Sphingomonas TaxID=13687 RepID=UPI000DEFF509|nr:MULTISPECIES: potassium transporter Kup [Sphingomonas]